MDSFSLLEQFILRVKNTIQFVLNNSGNKTILVLGSMFETKWDGEPDSLKI